MTAGKTAQRPGGTLCRFLLEFSIFCSQLRIIA